MINKIVQSMAEAMQQGDGEGQGDGPGNRVAVSYTHLTLPTILLV